MTKAGKTAEVWVCAPGLVRWQETPQRYEIAAGSRLWKIDEQANTVTTGDSPWFISPTKQIDLLGLLDVGVKEASPLLTARPVERAPFDGRDCFVYRVELPADSGQVDIEATADAKSNQLVEIVARAAGVPANAGPPLAELQFVAMNVPVDEASSSSPSRSPTTAESARSAMPKGSWSCGRCWPSAGRPCAARCNCGLAIGCAPTFAERTPSRSGSRPT